MMKRLNTILLLAFILLIKATPVLAQLQDQRHNFAIGANAGINLSQVSFQPTIKQGMLLGPEFGLTARFISERYFKMICGIQGEINFSRRGWKEEYEPEDPDSYKRIMNYIEIPVLAHLAFGKDRGNGFRFIVNLGPQIGFMINDKEKMNEGFDASKHPYGTEGQYGKAIENKFSYGLIAGLGVEAITGIGHFLVEGRYYFGLSDFYHSTKKDFFSRSAHSYIGVRVTYLFDLRKD